MKKFKEVNKTIISSSGFHGSSEIKGKECVECHSDHFGRDFEIIRFDEDKFDTYLQKTKDLEIKIDRELREVLREYDLE